MYSLTDFHSDYFLIMKFLFKIYLEKNILNPQNEDFNMTQCVYGKGGKIEEPIMLLNP